MSCSRECVTGYKVQLLQEVNTKYLPFGPTTEPGCFYWTKGSLAQQYKKCYISQCYDGIKCYSPLVQPNSKDCLTANFFSQVLQPDVTAQWLKGKWYKTIL